MFAILPILAWLIAAITLHRQVFNSGRVDDLIRAALLAAVAWGIYLTLVSEALSLAGALRFGPLLASWLLPVVLLLWLLRRRRIPAKGIEYPDLTPLQTGIVSIVAGAAAFTGLVAIASAPNTWDAMSYHLPRVMHWAQQGSIEHYATHEPRQLYLSPWAELAATHFQILSGGDRLVSLIQWFSMVGSLLAVGLIAGRLGAGLDGRISSVLIAATLPMGLLQSVSTQTDYVAGFFVLSTVALLPEGNAASRRPGLVGAAGAAALAVLAKATAYFFLAPFLAAFAWRQLRARRWAAWRPVLLIGAAILVVNLGHYSRNYRLFDSPLQPRGLSEYHRYANETFGPAAALSNLTRNAALHLVATPLSATRPLSANSVYGAIRNLHRLLGIEPDDPRTTWPGKAFEPAAIRVHEDESGNPLHFLLILVCGVAICVNRALRASHPGLATHALLAGAGVLLFVSVLKWTPWSSRLHLPAFLLFSPMAGVVSAHLSRHRFGRPLGVVLAVTLAAQAVPFVASNPLHPVRGPNSVFSVPRARQYFLYSRPLLGEFYRSVEQEISAADCDRVGLAMPPDAWEYPLWVTLRPLSPPPRIESLEVDDITRQLQDPGFEPCAVVCVRCAPERRNRYRAELGEPVLISGDDHAHGDDHMLFLE